MTSNHTEYDGHYGVPATLMWWNAVWVGAVGGSVSTMTTAKAFIAPQSCCTWGERVGAKLVGFQTTWECLVPGCNLCGV